MDKGTTKSSGGRPTSYSEFPDEMDFLKNYSADQINSIWEGCKPKISKVKGKVVILGGTNGVKYEKD